jgi:hypothetical protein
MIDILKLLKKEAVNSKLLEYGLFSEKLTPIFQSKLYGIWMKKTGLKMYKDRSFSCVSYRLTRNNNAPRIIEIPHPIAYFRLCEEIRINWKEIIKKIGEIDDYPETSMVIPKPNNLNHRLVSMKSYDKRDDEKFLILDKSFSKKYLVHIDIANCYPSIYSHSVAWALVGHQEAKDNMDDRTKWYNKLDFAIRSMQKNETVGIPIGPDTSSLISELVLSRVDKSLDNYEYLRFIDDYRCYCKSKEEADEFIRKASRELEKYHLRLNPKKTKIVALPIPIDEDWVRALRQYSSKFLKKNKYKENDINTLSEFIDLAIKLSKDNPGDSPIRYAVKILSNKLYADERTFGFVIMYLSRLCFIYPYFIDVFDEILERNEKNITKEILALLETEINSLTKEHIKYSRSDVSLWGLKLALKYKFSLEDFENYSDQLITDRDCLPTLLCYFYAKDRKLKSIKKFFTLVETLITEKTEDEWWLYIYELYKEKPRKPELKKIQYKDYYEEMRKAAITFIV